MTNVFLKIWLHEAVLLPPVEINIASADQRDVATLTVKAFLLCLRDTCVTHLQDNRSDVKKSFQLA